MSGRRWIILVSALGGTLFVALLALIVVGVLQKKEERRAFIANYLEQCSRDFPRYECEMRVELLRTAWRTEDSADIAAAMAASSAASSATAAANRR